jgi:hypothetical protein
LRVATGDSSFHSEILEPILFQIRYVMPADEDEALVFS